MRAVAERWLRARLAGDPALASALAAGPGGYGPAVYEDLAPSDTGWPYAVFVLVSSEAVRAGDQEIWGERFFFDVQVHGKGRRADVKALGAAVDALLEGFGGGFEGYRVDVRRRDWLGDTRIVDGGSYGRSGGLYEVLVRPGGE